MARQLERREIGDITRNVQDLLNSLIRPIYCMSGTSETLLMSDAGGIFRLSFRGSVAGRARHRRVDWLEPPQTNPKCQKRRQASDPRFCPRTSEPAGMKRGCAASAPRVRSERLTALSPVDIASAHAAAAKRGRLFDPGLGIVTTRAKLRLVNGQRCVRRADSSISRHSECPGLCPTRNCKTWRTVCLHGCYTNPRRRDQFRDSNEDKVAGSG